MIDEFFTALQKIVIWTMGFLFILIVTIFVLKNTHEITLNLNIFNISAYTARYSVFQIPLWLYSLYVFMIGATLGVGLMWYFLSDVKKSFVGEQKNKLQLEKDIETLKKNISKTITS